MSQVVDPFADSKVTKGTPINLSLIISQTQRLSGESDELARGEERNEVSQRPDETAYWNPAIVTDKSGRAKVIVNVPRHSTAWTLIAKGITTDTLAGETTEHMVARKDLFGQLKLPSALVDGDRADVIASVHNGRVTEGSIDVTLTTTIAGRTVKQTRTVKVTSKGIPGGVGWFRACRQTEEYNQCVESWACLHTSSHGA